MAKEYIEREEVIKILEHYDLSSGSTLGCHSGAIECAISAIEMLPAADVAPVVRCQDCVYARPLKDMNYDYLCHYWNGHSCNQNQFCSQGKRKEDI